MCGWFYKRHVGIMRGEDFVINALYNVSTTITNLRKMLSMNIVKGLRNILSRRVQSHGMRVSFSEICGQRDKAVGEPVYSFVGRVKSLSRRDTDVDGIF